MAGKLPCASSRQLLSGNSPVNTRLSRELELRFRVARAVPVGRAALGLVAVLRCWRQGRSTCRIALPGAVCPEVVLAVLAADCDPIFCDVNPADGLVPESEWLRARSQGADVALIVHLYGNPARTACVRALFPAPDCLVVDDAAQALGSFSQDGPAGASGDVGLLSFGPTKQISIGNAAMLFRSIEFAQEVAPRLDDIEMQPQAIRDASAAAFRSRLDTARARLRSEGDEGAVAFAGMLEGLKPVLSVPYYPERDAAVLDRLQAFPDAARVRIDKRAAWSSGLQGTGLVPVGMGEGCVPWRYVCRLPGTTWDRQHRISEALRAAGMHVSNWYLPAHWFVGQPAGMLPGVEKLAREVFQFWLDEAASLEAIGRESARVRQQIASLAALSGDELQ